MITEDYVSFEVAKLLKEKGFNSIDCKNSPHYAYNADGRFSGPSWDTEYSAPTLQMAMKWLRIKNIFIDIFHYNSKMAPFVWLIFAYNVLTPQRAKTYEEAEEAAIRYVLENWDDVNKVLDEYYKYDNLSPKI